MILIALGANLASASGPPEVTLQAALKALATENVTVEAVSRLYRTPAWPDPRDPEFVNAAARLATNLSPQKLLGFLHAVETAFGRNCSSKNAPRTLDLDLLDYDGRVEGGPPVLPHPRMAQRAFVLVPLRDVAPDWRHPADGRSIGAMLAALGAEAHLPIPIGGKAG